LHSSVLVANAWHHRTDAFSSVIALVGTGGAALGFPFLDPVGGLLVAGMIIKVAVDVGSGAAYSLTDRQTEMDLSLVEGVTQVSVCLFVCLLVCLFVCYATAVLE
jgi:divalent metal cation (Fe/Co/Zn/Cd) transporter